MSIFPDSHSISGNRIIATGDNSGPAMQWKANFWTINADYSTTHTGESAPLDPALVLAGGARSGMDATTLSGVGAG
jgi:hypothetical protein